MGKPGPRECQEEGRLRFQCCEKGMRALDGTLGHHVLWGESQASGVEKEAEGNSGVW